jgi:hypothetical protein
MQQLNSCQHLALTVASSGFPIPLKNVIAASMNHYGSVTQNVLRYTRRENGEEFRVHARTPSDGKDEMKCQRGVVCWLAEATVKVDTSYCVYKL